MIKNHAHLCNGVTERAPALRVPVYSLTEGDKCGLGAKTNSSKQELLSMYRPCFANKCGIAQEIDIRVVLLIKIGSLQDGQDDLDRDASSGDARSWNVIIKFMRKGARSELEGYFVRCGLRMVQRTEK